VVGGTVPAEIWRTFMSSALAVDHSVGPRLPVSFERQQHERLQSPLPPEWSNATKPLRDIAHQLQSLFGEDRR
jgi:penicillin-binding protein 1A